LRGHSLTILKGGKSPNLQEKGGRKGFFPLSKGEKSKVSYQKEGGGRGEGNFLFPKKGGGREESPSFAGGGRAHSQEKRKNVTCYPIQGEESQKKNS